MPAFARFTLRRPGRRASRLAPLLFCGTAVLASSLPALAGEPLHASVEPRALAPLDTSVEPRAATFGSGVRSIEPRARSIEAQAAGVEPADANVSTLEMLSRLEQPWVQLIDVRSADEYAGRDIRALRGGHIPGAVNIPFEATRDGLAARLSGFDRRKETIIYGHDAAQARRFASLLRAEGFRHVRVYGGAWQAWGNSLELPVAGERFADVGALRDRLDALQRTVARLSAQAASPAPGPAGR